MAVVLVVPAQNNNKEKGIIMAKKAKGKSGLAAAGAKGYKSSGANFKKAQKSGMKGKMMDSIENLESVK